MLRQGPHEQHADCMPGLSGAGWTAGMAGPQRLKDLCCSEEQRPVERVVVVPVHDIVECESESRSRGDKTDFVSVQITSMKDVVLLLLSKVVSGY